MKKLLYLISFFTIATIISAQPVADRTKNVKITSDNNGTSIPYANVANMRTGFCFQSNFKGEMKLSLATGDTLLFRSMGYKDTTIVISMNEMLSDTIVMNVNIKPHMIKEVEVLAFKSYGAFRSMFANLVIEDKKSALDMNFTINTKEIAALSKATAGGVGIGMTVDWGFIFGETPQQKYKKFLAQENKMERVRNLTSHENLAEFTGLKNASLDSFVVFLRGNYTLTADLSDYQVMESVKNAFDQFLAMREGKGKN